MIKLNQTQAKAVASKIREKILQHNREVRKQMKDAYINSDDYKNKQREIREMVIVVYQTQTKVGRKYTEKIIEFNGDYHYETDNADYCNNHLSTYRNPNRIIYLRMLRTG